MMRLKGLGTKSLIVVIILLFFAGPAYPQEKAAAITTPAGTGDASKMRLVLIFDKSRSVKAGQWAMGKKLAAALTETLTPENEVALIAVGDQITDLTGFTKDHKALQKPLDGLAPVDNRTLLFEAVYLATEQLGREPRSQKAILLFTDGLDDGSYLSDNDCIDKVKQNNIKVLAFNIGKKEGKGANFLKRLAKVSEGSYFDSLTLDQAQVLKALQRSGQRETAAVQSLLPPEPSRQEAQPAVQTAPAPDPGKVVVPLAEPDGRNLIIGLLSASVLLLIGLVGFIYRRSSRISTPAETRIVEPQVGDLELGTLRLQAKQLQEEAKQLEEQMLLYGDLREEKIRRWRDVSFDMAKKAVEVLKTCWLEREDPLGFQIYGELLSNLKAIGVEEINPRVGDEVNEEDRRYWIREKTGNPPYKVTKVVYPGYYFRPRVGEKTGEKNLLEAAQVEVTGV